MAPVPIRQVHAAVIFTCSAQVVLLIAGWPRLDRSHGRFKLHVVHFQIGHVLYDLSDIHDEFFSNCARF